MHWGRANSSLVIRRAFQHNFDRHRDGPISDQYRKKIRENSLERIRAHIQNQTAPIDIISAEEISTFNKEELQDLQAFLCQYYERITVHLYVRPIKSYFESAFQQVLKARYTNLRAFPPRNFNSIMKKMDASFGAKNVIFHKYERTRFPQGSVVAHFLEQLGTELQSGDYTERNLGFSLPAVKLLYLYRTHYPKKIEGDDARIQRLFELAGPAFKIHSEFFKKLEITSRSHAKLFEQRAGFSISEDFYANDDVGITSEEDLVDISEETVNWLNLALSKNGNNNSVISNTAAAIALGVKSLV